jgi:hypothetical protein
MKLGHKKRIDRERTRELFRSSLEVTRGGGVQREKDGKETSALMILRMPLTERKKTIWHRPTFSSSQQTTVINGDHHHQVKLSRTPFLLRVSLQHQQSR